MKLNSLCYLPVSRSVLGKTVPEFLSTAKGHGPRAILETEGTVFPKTSVRFELNKVSKYVFMSVQYCFENNEKSLHFMLFYGVHSKKYAKVGNFRSVL